MHWPSVEHGLANISSRELSEWIAFDAVEPIGAARLDFLATYVITAMMRLWQSKDAPAVKMADLIPNFWQHEAEPQSIEEQRAMLLMLKAVFQRK